MVTNLPGQCSVGLVGVEWWREWVRELLPSNCSPESPPSLMADPPPTNVFLPYQAVPDTAHPCSDQSPNAVLEEGQATRPDLHQRGQGVAARVRHVYEWGNLSSVGRTKPAHFQAARDWSGQAPVLPWLRYRMVRVVRVNLWILCPKEMKPLKELGVRVSR